MRKSGLDGAFLRLQNQYICIEYLTHVPSEYLISCVLLSLKTMAGQTSWPICSIPLSDRSEIWKLCCAVKFIFVTEASRFVAIEVKSRITEIELHLRDCMGHQLWIRTICVALYPPKGLGTRLHYMYVRMYEERESCTCITSAVT
jgi:hypothetical protein